MQQKRTCAFLLDIGLFDRRLVGIMRRIERVPDIQTRVRDDDIGFALVPTIRMTQIHVGSDIRTGLDTKIDTDILTAERETQPLRVGVEGVPAIAESETAIAGVEAQIDGWDSLVEKRECDFLRSFRHRKDGRRTHRRVHTDHGIGVSQPPAMLR